MFPIAFQLALTPPRLPRILLSLTMALLLTACTENGASTNHDNVIRPVRVETAMPSPASSHRFVARVEAASTVDLAFQVGGQLTDHSPHEGTLVTRGKTLATLDTTDFELALRQVETRHEQARREYERLRRLHAQNAASTANFEQAEAEFRTQAVALEQARRQLAYTRIEAPFDALVTRRLAEPFATVAANAPVLRVQDMSELRLRFHVPERLSAILEHPEAYRMEAIFEAAPERRFPVRYREHRPQPDPVGQSYPVSVTLPRPSALELLPGMTASIVVSRFSPAPTGVTVPLSALDPGNDGQMRVWRFDPDSQTVTPRPVTLGAALPDRVTVLEGLTEGEPIVTSGTHLLRDGMRVRPQAHLD
ncbi:efflux RND transporter periplasmic adaptor subunit [Billgrantia endophytica]|uniref:Efflux RND transporter periplasmic adaptor subunit n=1 Tax=Billgrantia endophytica TaxID=2033802 RepID=A0A2N7U7W9_9GAMM|nr:efflux RND transporter periplasmic adaptor subunit [Halomonas endophytica]PMR76499.1 efflux RND transporter periplasmic adaptor subunit [Halomonas endophytica]